MKLEEIEKLCEEATPGPWEYTPVSNDGFDDWTLYNPKTTEYIKQDDSGVPITDTDGEFIAASRTLMPKLLAVAKAARIIEGIEQCLCCDKGYEEEDCSCYDALDAHDRLRKALEKLEKE